MTDYATADYYTDTALVDDPHAYFAFLRDKGPVTRLPHRNVVAITGYDEAVQVMLDTEHFSSINAVTGPIPGLPFEPEGDDISGQLEAHRHKIAFADQVVTVDGQRHLDLRSVMATLFTPSRLKALEPSLASTADALIDEFIKDGKVDLPRQYGCPYATLMIADLLGIPPAGRKRMPFPASSTLNSIPAPQFRSSRIRFGNMIWPCVHATNSWRQTRPLRNPLAPRRRRHGRGLPRPRPQAQPRGRHRPPGIPVSSFLDLSRPP